MLIDGAQTIASSGLIAMPFLGVVNAGFLLTITKILGVAVLTSFTVTRVIRHLVK